MRALFVLSLVVACAPARETSRIPSAVSRPRPALPPTCADHQDVDACRAAGCLPVIEHDLVHVVDGKRCFDPQLPPSASKMLSCEPAGAERGTLRRATADGKTCVDVENAVANGPHMRCMGFVPPCPAAVARCATATTLEACRALGEPCAGVTALRADWPMANGGRCFKHDAVGDEQVFVGCQQSVILEGMVGWAVDPATGFCLNFSSISVVPPGWKHCGKVMPLCP